VAIGSSLLFGYRLPVNFNAPYTAHNLQEFWHRWHISLSTWLRDYLYVPLGGSREGTFRTYRNLLITMFLGGLWHGAAWHFVAWGVFHGLLLCVYRAAAPLFERVPRVVSIVAFFHVTCFGWLLFEVKGLSDVPVLLNNLRIASVHGRYVVMSLLLFAAPLVLMEWAEERSGVVSIVRSWRRPFRLACYASLVAFIVLCGSVERHAFIYFQF